MRIIVVGDVILDVASYAKGVRPSQEDRDVAVFDVGETRETLGGAGAVALAARAMGADVDLCFPLGNHGPGWAIGTIERTLAAAGVGAMFSVASRPVTIKERFWNNGRQVRLRVDREQAGPMDGRDEDALAARLLDCQPADVVLVADYGKGAVFPKLLWPLHGHIVPIVVDPARGKCWARDYPWASIIKANSVEYAEQEARYSVSIWDNPGLAHVLQTMGPAGCQIRSRKGAQLSVPAPNIDEADVTGCGDVFFAALGVALAGGLGIVDATAKACAAGALCAATIGIPAPTWERINELQSGGNYRSVAERAAAGD